MRPASPRSSCGTRCWRRPARTTCATSTASPVTGEVALRPEGNANPDLPTGEIEVVCSKLEVLSPSAAAAVPDRRAGHRRRGGPAEVPLPRPAAARARRRPPAAQRGQPGRPHPAGRAGLRRDRDPDHDPLHAGGRARLPGSGPAAAGMLVRAAAEPAAVQAAAHGGRDGALLPDRALLPRRGLPGRPAAGVHPARHRDELRRAGRRHRADRGADPGHLGAGRRRGRDTDPAADLRRGDGPVRHRQARPAVRTGADRADGVLRRRRRSGSSRPTTSAPW